MIMRENYVQKIMAFADTPFVKVITGVRRSGKSTIMQMIMERLAEQGIAAEQIVSFRFDSMEYEGYLSGSFRARRRFPLVYNR